MPGRADFLVERRGFEPLISAARDRGCISFPPLVRPAQCGEPHGSLSLAEAAKSHALNESVFQHPRGTLLE